MKTYGIHPENINIGEYEIAAIVLGEEGRGRKKVIVPCPQGGAEFLHPGITKSGRPRLNPAKSRQGWVVRVSTQGSYCRGADGNVSVPQDNQTTIAVVAKGWGAFGDAGAGTWDDLLIVSKQDNFFLRVKPTRGDAYILLFDVASVNKISYPGAVALDIDLNNSTPTSRGEMIRL